MSMRRARASADCRGVGALLPALVLLATWLVVPAAIADTGETSGATSGVSPPAAAASTDPATRRLAPGDKVTICHRTRSRTNPYDQVVVSTAAAVNAHADHLGPVFGPGVEEWGDIIPPIQPGLPDGLNWPAGRAVLQNGCETTPDPGPLPAAVIGDLACDPDASLFVRLLNRPSGTAPATFTIAVDGTVVQTVGPLLPGTVQVADIGPALAPYEDRTVVIDVRAGDAVLASRVVTVDCAPDAAAVRLGAALGCDGRTPRGKVTVTNNGTAPVEVVATVDGTPVAPPRVVPPGETATGSADLSAYEDRAVVAQVLVDGVVVATYPIRPDCVRPEADPSIRVSGLTCPLTAATATLTNGGDPGSRVVFVIRVNGRVAQVSAPLHGGESTTIVGDLSSFEDRTITVDISANGRVLGSRTFTVDCRQAQPPGPGPDPGRDPGRDPGPGPGGETGGETGDGPGTASEVASESAGTDAGTHGSTASGAGEGPDTLPQVGSDVSLAHVVLAAALVLVGTMLMVVGRRRRRTEP